MRVKKDNRSRKARSVLARDARHDPSAVPEEDRSKVRPKKPRPPKNHHKHVWVEVEYDEYVRYASRYHWRRFPSWLYPLQPEPPYWAGYTTYYVCAGCLDTKRKVDEGKRRARYRRRGWRP